MLDMQADFQRALENKYKLGAGDTFKAWLPVPNISSCGNNFKIPRIKSYLAHHLLSEMDKIIHDKYGGNLR